MIIDRRNTIAKIWEVVWHHEVNGVMCRDTICASTSESVAHRALAAAKTQLESRNVGGEVVLNMLIDGVVCQPSPLTSEEVDAINSSINGTDDV